MKYSELSKKVPCDRGYLYHVGEGTTVPAYRMAVKIALALGVPPSEFLARVTKERLCRAGIDAMGVVITAPILVEG